MPNRSIFNFDAILFQKPSISLAKYNVDLASDANVVDVAKNQFLTNQVESAENQLTANQTRPLVPDGQTGGRSKGRSGQNSAR